ncbi:MAG: arylsulfatase [Limisphaerales bacterium]
MNLSPLLSLLPIALTCFVATAGSAPLQRARNIPANRPNIILILTDDQGYGDLGITGNPIVRTPNIDALARRSASLSDFYVCPVCSPTRACLMTGRYNYRTGVVDTFIGRSMMNPAEVTIAQILRNAGYTTGIFGKWHLGDCYPLRPIDRGFDEELVLRGGGLAQPADPIENHNRYTNPILIHNGQQVATMGYCTDVYFDAAMRFMDRARQARKPFFIYLPTNAPHRPVDDVPRDLYEKYRKMDLTPVLLGHKENADYLARVFAMEENIDENVGRLEAKLKADGLFEDTIVIYLADNGPDSHRYVGPFRGQKTEVLEGGVHTFFFMQWPARLQAGATSDHLTAHIDVMPTLLEAVGVSAPAGLKLDGRSFLPLLEGKQVRWPDRVIVTQSHRGNVPVRYHNFELRTERWKLDHPSGFGRETLPPDVPFELYDIRKDPAEEHNVATENPEVVRRLKASYDAWFDDVSSSHPGNYAPPRIVVGTDRETRTVLTWQDWRPRLTTFRWGLLGKWLLHFARERDYDLEFRWPHPVQPGTILLTIGALNLRANVPQATNDVFLGQVHVPPGDADLAAVLVHPDGTMEDPYHVVLLRK